MVKRLLDCSASDFKTMDKKEILDSIRLSEGRVIVSEIIGTLQPVLFNISNAELASAFGSDILLLNMFDAYRPTFNGIGKTDCEDIIGEIKRLTGRLIGINLEPVEDINMLRDQNVLMSEGRIARADTARKVYEMGADMIVITGNPGTSVSDSAIIKSIKEIREELKDNIIIAAGKMHAAGVMNELGSKIISKKDIEEFIVAGCDIVLIPAPGTVPGITLEYVKELTEFAHDRGILVMSVIGTSQEGSDEDTIKRIALMCKMAGVDIHHLGDAGYPGIAAPENILAYSITIRGKRHTYSRMARSIER